MSAQQPLSLRDRLDIVDNNFGRIFGWEVLSAEREPVAHLHSYAGNGIYKVTPLNGHTETLTEQFWYPDCHFLRNLGYAQCEICTFGHLVEDQVHLRFDHIDVRLTKFERLIAPIVRFW